MRAELLVLRKWRAAWALLLVTPVLTFVVDYVVGFITYVTDDPAQYAQLGTPAQNLPALLPSQFVIAATSLFPYSGAAAFAVLGALVAGGDWGRGTIRTSLLQGPGRLRSFAGQVLALTAALAATVMVTFLLCAAASLVIAKIEASAIVPPQGQLPGAWMIIRGLGASMLVAMTYGTAGLALGTICRSAAGAIAAALLWTVIIENGLDNMATQAGGLFLLIGNIEPASAAGTITFLFYKATGSAIYLPMSPAQATWTLAGYTAAFLAIAAFLVRRRDIAAWTDGFARRGPARSAVPADAPAASSPQFPGSGARLRAAGWTAGTLACLRAELLVMRKRPAVWALAGVLPVNMLITFYLTGYVYYRTAAHGLTLGVDPQQVLSALSPGQYLSAPLIMLGNFSSSYSAVIFVLLGALVAGSDWARGTIRTALLQAPGRLQARIGQDLAVMITTAASVALTFILAAAASAVTTLARAGALAPADSRYPGFAHLAGAIGGALVLTLAYTAIGLALGTLLRSDSAAVGLAVLWAVIVQSNLDDIFTWRGLWLTLYKILPDASANTISNLYNTVFDPVPGTVIQPPMGVQVLPATAVLTLSLYLVASLAIPALITWRRDIT